MGHARRQRARGAQYDKLRHNKLILSCGTLILAESALMGEISDDQRGLVFQCWFAALGELIKLLRREA